MIALFFREDEEEPLKNVGVYEKFTKEAYDKWADLGCQMLVVDEESKLAEFLNVGTVIVMAMEFGFIGDE